MPGVSQKMSCPGCGAHLSSVLRAYDDGGPCPECGLSSEATAEIIAVQRTRADIALRDQLTQAIAARGKAEQRVGELERRLADILSALDVGSWPDWMRQ